MAELTDLTAGIAPSAAAPPAARADATATAREVLDRPDLVAKGDDPTLEEAVRVLLEELRASPPGDPVEP